MPNISGRVIVLAIDEISFSTQAMPAVTQTVKKFLGTLTPDEVAELTTPDAVVWCDGSADEWKRLTDDLVAAGTLVRLDEKKRPNSFWARTDPTDVARVEERTFICSVDEADAGAGEGRPPRVEPGAGPG